MVPDSPETFRCPTCRAQQERSDVCRRCKCDLRLVHAAHDAYHAARLRCLAELRAGRSRAALAFAREILLLDPSSDARRLFAVCALLADDFRAALSAARLEPEER